ncbi:hypothetical protein IFM89_030673 [Coptis chinensis]|uniref:Uncharacterized protein n=1 Tax=Coptis chinensis TaxID=261450 RepID=A0A835J2P8_9MAGN|nr:hypothetical protein IFM89_030673 [Coptis chinensis]
MMTMDTPIDVVVSVVNTNTNVNAQSITSEKLNGKYFGYLQTRWEEIGHHDAIVELTGEAAKLVAERIDRQKVYAFMMGLRPEFELLSQVLGTRPFPSLMTAFSLIDDEDRRRMLRHSNSPTPVVQGLADHSALASDSSHYRYPGQCGRGHGG